MKGCLQRYWPQLERRGRKLSVGRLQCWLSVCLQGSHCRDPSEDTASPPLPFCLWMSGKVHGQLNFNQEGCSTHQALAREQRSSHTHTPLAILVPRMEQQELLHQFDQISSGISILCPDLVALIYTSPFPFREHSQTQ